MNKFNVWSFSSFLISFVVIIPILTVSVSFFEETSNYYQILKDTFLLEYIFNSAVLLIGVLILTFLMGTGSAYLVSFFNHLTLFCRILVTPTNKEQGFL